MEIVMDCLNDRYFDIHIVNACKLFSLAVHVFMCESN